MHARVAIVALDIASRSKVTSTGIYLDEEYASYTQLPVDQKIDLIRRKMLAICEALTDKEPNSLWIIAWREYGIFAEDGKIVSLEDKIHLKCVLGEMIERYPQLTILAGTIAHKKHFKDYSVILDEIDHDYQKHQWIADGEIGSREQTKKHREKIQIIRKTCPLGIDVVRNTTYVMNKTGLKRVDKIAPWDEIQNCANEDVMIFHPRGTVEDHIFDIAHPLDSKPVKVGIEICREHITKVVQKPTDIHFILSSGAALSINNIPAETLAVVHIDSAYAPKLVSMQKDLEAKLPIHFYQYDAIHADPHLTLKPPIYPLQLSAKSIVILFDEALTHIPLDHGKFRALNEIKLNAQQLTKKIAIKESDYVNLMQLLDKHKKILSKYEPYTRPYLGMFGQRIPLPDTKILYENAMAMTEKSVELNKFGDLNATSRDITKTM